MLKRIGSGVVDGSRSAVVSLAQNPDILDPKAQNRPLVLLAVQGLLKKAASSRVGRSGRTSATDLVSEPPALEEITNQLGTPMLWAVTRSPICPLLQAT